MLRRDFCVVCGSVTSFTLAFSRERICNDCLIWWASFDPYLTDSPRMPI